MNYFLQIHPIQISILNYLSFHPHARYSELNTTKMTTDHFNFHIKRLQDNKLVEKNMQRYTLTINGKKLLNTIANEELLFQQYKTVVLIICKTKINGLTKYLLQKRHKEPFFGVYDLLAGKVKWDETTQDAANRVLQEKTSIEAQTKFQSVEHKIDKDNEGNILENKFLYIYTCTLPSKNTNNIKGENLTWVSKEELVRLKPIFSDIPSILQKKKNTYSEKTFLALNY